MKELSQQLTETSDQFAYIRKVDHLISIQTLALTAAVVTAASSTASGLAPSSGSSCFPLGQATLLQGTGLPLVSQASLFIAQPSTASCSVSPSTNSNHISRHAASAIHTNFLQANWDLQDHAQTMAFQDHGNDA